MLWYEATESLYRVTVEDMFSYTCRRVLSEQASSAITIWQYRDDLRSWFEAAIVIAENGCLLVWNDDGWITRYSPSSQRVQADGERFIDKFFSLPQTKSFHHIDLVSPN